MPFPAAPFAVVPLPAAPFAVVFFSVPPEADPFRAAGTFFSAGFAFVLRAAVSFFAADAFAFVLLDAVPFAPVLGEADFSGVSTGCSSAVAGFLVVRGDNSTP
ncbi:hypothetical protein [Nocardiopsis eucommiae]|uniref:hypothetical protein n=1 Tax=Nocardiopsis eucommiae TaxID=2831970 RepID=UPI003D751B1F